MGAIRDGHNRRMAKIFEQQRSREMCQSEMAMQEHEEYEKKRDANREPGEPTQAEVKAAVERISKLPEYAQLTKYTEVPVATRDLVTGNVSYILAVLEISCTKPEVLAICNKKLAELRDLALKG